jgi:CHAT domain-containing protein
VVLSACETACGRLLAGEGAWGFVAQFLGSGARNVVASLWRVDDQSTANLMQGFYLAMAPGFADYGNALRSAKLQLLNGQRWRHPYFWAPFVLYGGLP